MLSLQERVILRQQVDQCCQSMQYREAILLLEKASKEDPTYLWYLLFIGDVYRYYLKEESQALIWYQACYNQGKEVFNTTPYSPLRYLLKRLSEITYRQEKWDQAVQYLEEFIAFRPSNFHESDFLRFASALLNTNQKEKAIEILQLGMQFSKSRAIREQYNIVTGEQIPLTPFSLMREGFIRIPIKTDIIKPGQNIPKIAEECTRHIRQKGDIITISSCVVAVAESRMKTIDVLYSSSVARFLASFVHDDNYDFGGNAPLCNPLSMQMAIDEAGLARILVAAVFGGVISKLWKGSGMFYRLAGEQAALIDDMPGAIPPFDYSIILGPKNANHTSSEIKEITGCDAAILDANDLNIAWVVGSSNHELNKKIQKSMQDNPAGNGDQQTPIILLRPQ